MSWPWAGLSRRPSVSAFVIWTLLNVAVGRLTWAFRSRSEVDLVTVWVLAATALVDDCGLVFDAHDTALLPVWFGFAKGEFSVPRVIEKTEDPVR